jgi:hypothetical protein
MKMDTHKHWKHVKSGKLALVVGLAVYAGGVHEPLGDMAGIIVKRPKGMDGWADLDVVPGHYTIADVKTADAGKLQTSDVVKYGDQLVVYQHGDDVWARPTAEFYDGRFVKVDEAGNELAVEKKSKAATAVPLNPGN